MYTNIKTSHEVQCDDCEFYLSASCNNFCKQMDRSKSPYKTTMSFPTIKYNVNQDEIEEIYSSTDLDKSSALDVSDNTDRSKKSDKAGPSIIDKYLKAFKVDKNTEEENKAEGRDVGSDKKGSDISDVSGSPIKEYFSKFQKRSDSIENNSDAETAKDAKDLSERWKLFSDIKVKFAQAVEDIKSSRTNEEIKEKQNSVEDISDSEENSLHQELDPSMGSTENQVSSISSSTQNLSDLSLGLSHSSTITDSEMETNTSSDSNPLNVTPTADKKDDKAHRKTPIESSKLSKNETECADEIESGIEALEDFELSKNIDINETVMESEKDSIIVKRSDIKTNIVARSSDEVITFFSYPFILFSLFVLTSLFMLPTFIMTNGVFLGFWLSNFFHKLYLSLLNYFGYNKELTYDRRNFKDITISKVPQIVEFEPLKKYEGWVNIFSYKKYDPALYHISLTNTVYMKLEGSRLRLSYTYRKIPKRAMYDEKEHDVSFYEHKIFDLDGAQIFLLPLGIVKKRHWSKKYPICIKIEDRNKITVVSHIQSDAENDKSSARNGKNKDNSPSDSSGSTKATSVSKDTNLDTEKSEKIISEKTLIDLDSNAANVVKLGTPKKLNKEKHLHKEGRGRKTKTKVKQFHMEDFMTDDSDEDVYKDPPLDNDHDLPQSDETSLLTNNEFLATEYFYTANNKTETETEAFNLYLFCRTGREKAEWFKRLKAAIDEVKSQRNVPESIPDNTLDEKCDSNDTSIIDNADNELDSKARLGNVKSDKKTQDPGDTSVLWTSSSGQAAESLLSESFIPVQDIDFWKYMRSIVEKKYTSNDDSYKSDIDNYLWLNALLGRVAFDAFRNPSWVLSLQERIQKKLSSIKLPPFMGPLIMSNLELGYEAPLVLDASAPTLDACGVWIDLQLSYSGKATMTLTTQLNLMSLKERKDTVSSEESQDENKAIHRPIPPYSKKTINMAVFDSDLEDTAESSSDDEACNISTSQIMPVENLDIPQLNVGNTPAKKLLRIVDKIAANKYFQHVTEYKYVKRAMEGVSKTDLKLNVELCELVGCFTINIPPPPSDRLWFGFRGTPHLVIKAKPILGSRVINFGHVTGWIEKRLIKEFEKILVYPNLEDIIIDSMAPPPL